VGSTAPAFQRLLDGEQSTDLRQCLDIRWPPGRSDEVLALCAIGCQLGLACAAPLLRLRFTPDHPEMLLQLPHAMGLRHEQR